jgi:hypothetical protein
MRKVVSEAWLRDEITAHMSDPAWDPSRIQARPVYAKRTGEGPNWRYTFNEGAVPAGFKKRWEGIRAKFEATYDLAEEQSG